MSKVSKKLYGTVLIKADLVGVLSQSGEPLTMNDISNHADITLLTSSKILNTRILLGDMRCDEGGRRLWLRSIRRFKMNLFLLMN